MKFALHQSYLSALMHVLAKDNDLDYVFDINDINDHSATQTLINDALAPVSPSFIKDEWVKYDVRVVTGNGGGALLGYIRAYLDMDGTVVWAHSLC